MNNPYEAPNTYPTTRSTARRGWLHLVFSLLIATFCILQFLGILLATLQAVSGLGLGEVPILTLLGMLVLPFTLFLGGVFLAFGRKLAVLSFAAYLGLYLAEMIVRESFGNLLAVIVAILFLAYSAWLWRCGKLSGWPNNSFKGARSP